MRIENNQFSVIESKERFIISSLKELINNKNLEAGEKLPSERILAEKLDVTRGSIRNAIQKLEHYGLLKSMPQSGNFIANIGRTALNGMIDQIINLSTPNFKSLVETRIFLELKIVKFAASRRSSENMKEIEEAEKNYKNKTMKGEDSVAEDLLFHLSIAKASNNESLHRLMLTITPQIIIDFEKYHVCKNNIAMNAIDEHRAIVNAIKNRDADMAASKMKEHFNVLYQYCYET